MLHAQINAYKFAHMYEDLQSVRACEKYWHAYVCDPMGTSRHCIKKKSNSDHINVWLEAGLD
jgi:hypothetical protein